MKRAFALEKLHLNIYRAVIFANLFCFISFLFYPDFVEVNNSKDCEIIKVTSVKIDSLRNKNSCWS